MLRRSAFLMLLLLSPAGAFAQQSADPLVTAITARLRALVGEGNGGDAMRYRAVRAEGRAVIVDVELAERPNVVGPPHVATMVAAGICSDASAARFFSGGRVVRVNLSYGGQSLGSATADHCPGAIGQGASAATFASALQSFVGTEIDGVRLVSITAEDNMIVVAMDVLRGERAAGESAAAQFTGGFCGRAGAQELFFGLGMTLRVDTLVAGRDRVPGQVITTCNQ